MMAFMMTVLLLSHAFLLVQHVVGDAAAAATTDGGNMEDRVGEKGEKVSYGISARVPRQSP